MWNRVAFLVVAAAGWRQARGAGSSDYDDDHAHHHFEASWDSEAIAFWCLMTFIVFLTTLFEAVKEYATENVAETTAPIVQSIFEEMTVLGFLATITFLTMKTKIITQISSDIWGDDDHAKLHLFHMLENVHFSISFIMFTFLLHTLYLYSLCGATMTKWKGTNALVQDKEQIEKVRDIVRQPIAVDKGCASITVAGVLAERNRALQKLRFHSLRNEFIIGRSLTGSYESYPENHPERLPADFDFGLYLNYCLGRYMAKVIEVGILEWAFVWLLLTLWFVLAITIGERKNTLAILWVAVYFAFYAAIVYFSRYVNRMRGYILNPSDFRGIGLTALDAPGLYKLAETDKRTAPFWTEFASNRKSEKRSAMRRFFCGKAPSGYLKMFAFENNSPRFHSAVITSHLVYMSLYLCFLCIYFIPHAVETWNAGLVVAYTLIGFLPVCHSLYKTEVLLVRRIVIVDSVLSLRKPDIVAKVVRIQKTRRAMRTMLLIHSMRTSGPVIKLLRELDIRGATEDGKEGAHGTADKAPSFSGTVRKSIFGRAGSSDVKTVSISSGRLDTDSEVPGLQDAMTMFDHYDVDGSGFIEIKELGQIMDSLGVRLNARQLQQTYTVLDENGDGKISRDEFTSWYTKENPDDTIVASPQQLAESLFSMFDHEDGVITITQFKDGLDRFGANLTFDEVGDLIRELDEDNDGRINKEEFEKLLVRYEENHVKHELH